uniref:Endonuclease/exonuclease/phosphatase domain-containing protein n=1 Tax=Rhodnius prolixus TaxID=13249 RepID=T1HGT3_RHOPR
MAMFSGPVYFSPSLDIEAALDLLELTISEIQFRYSSHPMFIAGDFNSRVADLNQGDENLFQGTSLSYIRRNMDVVCNVRGAAAPVLFNTISLEAGAAGVHDINRTRHEHGEFHHLYEQLREHPDLEFF